LEANTEERRRKRKVRRGRDRTVEDMETADERPDLYGPNPDFHKVLPYFL
jgi:hypothetical protein